MRAPTAPIADAESITLNTVALSEGNMEALALMRQEQQSGQAAIMEKLGSVLQEQQNLSRRVLALEQDQVKKFTGLEAEQARRFHQIELEQASHLQRTETAFRV